MLTPLETLLVGLILFGYLPYVMHALKSTGRPNVTTWLLFLLFDVEFALSHWGLSRGPVVIAVSYGLGSLAVLACIAKKGSWEYSRFDGYCVLSVALTVIAWTLSRSATVGIIGGMLANFLSCLPTYRKAYVEPESESLESWYIFMVAAFVGICNITEISLAAIAYPTFNFIGCLCFVILIARSGSKRAPQS